MRHAIAFTTVLIVLGGCTSRRVLEPPVYLELSGPVAVDVETIGGNVVILADHTIVRPRVLIERESTHGHLRQEEALASLEEIDYSVEMTGGETGPLVRIRTTTTHVEPHFHRANVRIEVPEVLGVHVRTRDGDVEAVGIQGPIDIETGDGDVVVATPMPLLDPVRIVSGYGHVNVRVRGETTGELDFESRGGRVEHRGMYGTTIVHPGTDHDTFLASFNEGRNPIVLRTAEGNIRFVVDADPLAYRTFFFQ